MVKFQGIVVKTEIFGKLYSFYEDPADGCWVVDSDTDDLRIYCYLIRVDNECFGTLAEAQLALIRLLTEGGYRD